MSVHLPPEGLTPNMRYPHQLIRAAVALNYLMDILKHKPSNVSLRSDTLIWKPIMTGVDIHIRRFCRGEPGNWAAFHRNPSSSRSPCWCVPSLTMGDI